MPFTRKQNSKKSNDTSSGTIGNKKKPTIQDFKEILQKYEAQFHVTSGKKMKLQRETLEDTIVVQIIEHGITLSDKPLGDMAKIKKICLMCYL